MCAVCHGPRGEGYKADQAPALGHAAFLSSVSDEFLREAIQHGRIGTTMSAWGRERGGPLTSDDIQSLISFLHTWAPGEPADLDERALRGNASSGAAVYKRECIKCHGEHGTGGPNVSIGNRALLASASNGFLRQAITHGRRDTAMPAFDTKLGKNGIDDVVALLRSWQASATINRPPPVRPPPIPLGPVPLNPKGPEPVGFKTYPETTSVDVVQEQLARKAKMALLDARAPSDYMNDHIAGAVSVPFYDPTPYFAKLPKNTWIVAYCSCPHAESRSLAGALQKAGFTKVTVLDEGLGGWKRKKYETHKGDQP